MESFAYLLLLFEPKIFSSVLAVIVLISTVFYIKSGTGIMGVWEGGSFVIAVASPAFYWVYGITLEQHLLILIVCYVPFHIDTRQLLHNQLIDNHLIINNSIKRLEALLEEQQKRLDKIELSLMTFDKDHSSNKYD